MADREPEPLPATFAEGRRVGIREAALEGADGAYLGCIRRAGPAGPAGPAVNPAFAAEKAARRAAAAAAAAKAAVDELRAEARLSEAVLRRVRENAAAARREVWAAREAALEAAADGRALLGCRITAALGAIPEGAAREAAAAKAAASGTVTAAVAAEAAAREALAAFVRARAAEHTAANHPESPRSRFWAIAASLPGMPSLLGAAAPWEVGGKDQEGYSWSRVRDLGLLGPEIEALLEEEAALEAALEAASWAARKPLRRRLEGLRAFLALLVRGALEEEGTREGVRASLLGQEELLSWFRAKAARTQADNAARRARKARQD